VGRIKRFWIYTKNCSNRPTVPCQNWFKPFFHINIGSVFCHVTNGNKKKLSLIKKLNHVTFIFQINSHFFLKNFVFHFSPEKNGDETKNETRWNRKNWLFKFVQFHTKIIIIVNQILNTNSYFTKNFYSRF